MLDFRDLKINKGFSDSLKESAIKTGAHFSPRRIIYSTNASPNAANRCSSKTARSKDENTKIARFENRERFPP